MPVKTYYDEVEPDVPQEPSPIPPARKRNQLFAREKFKQGQISQLHFMRDKIIDWLAVQEKELREIQIEIRESKDQM